MQLSFVKVSPTQNVTVFVTTPVPREMQPAVAERLLAPDGVGGEQVGFFEPPTQPGAPLRLQMMGGEFCGNATMALGAYTAWKQGMAEGASAGYRFEVSGAASPVPCRIVRTADGFQGTVDMPLCEAVTEVALPTDRGELRLPLVVLPGIAHVVVPRASDWPSRAEIERRIRAWNAVVRAAALGVLRYDEAKGEMEPVVYVPSTDSVVWERGCGSGTAALGCYLAHRAGKSVEVEVRQPGGTIRVCAQMAGARIRRLTIAGRVRIVATGTAYL